MRIAHESPHTLRRSWIVSVCVAVAGAALVAAGALYLEESIAQPLAGAAHAAAPSADPGFYPRRQAAQVFEVS